MDYVYFVNILPMICADSLPASPGPSSEELQDQPASVPGTPSWARERDVYHGPYGVMYANGSEESESCGNDGASGVKTDTDTQCINLLHKNAVVTLLL
jgi:hypothetical protein